jgi:protease I
MDRRKIPVKTAAPQKKDVYGQGQMRVRPDLTLDEVAIGDFDAIVFIGGMGARELWDDARAHQIAKDAQAGGLLIAAVSTAPVILARAGILEGREATVYFSEKDQITQRGAVYNGNPIAVSDNIITCKGPEAVEKLALGLIKLLSERQKA